MRKLLLFFMLFFPPGSVLRAQVPWQPTPPSREDMESFKTIQREARNGDAKAMGTLGLMYEKGLGCAQDYAKAFYWMEHGAKKGDAASENNLGFLYLKGLGAGHDSSQALLWFQKAADQGLASAQANLGQVYGQGLGGVKTDYDRALLWFKKAAEQGDADSQVNLAQMLSLGEGTPRDYAESYKWFTIALKNPSLSDDRVGDLRGDIEWMEKRMTGAQVKDAQGRALAWEEAQATPTPGEP